MIDYQALARIAYAHAEANYGKKGARYDVIVECYSVEQIAKELEYARAEDDAAARRWADIAAGDHHEVELNQAWDGPESVASSSLYRPERGPG